MDRYRQEIQVGEAVGVAPVRPADKAAKRVWEVVRVWTMQCVS